MIIPTLNRCFPLFWCTMMVQLLCIARTNGQTVIGGDTVDQSAILDIQDTAKGVLLTRITTDQRNGMFKSLFDDQILFTTSSTLNHIVTAKFSVKWGQ